MIPWVRKIPWRRKWQPTPVFLPEKIPWTEELGGLQSVRSQKVRFDWVTEHTHVRSKGEKTRRYFYLKLLSMSLKTQEFMLYYEKK